MSTGRGDAPTEYARAVSAEVRMQIGKRWWSGNKLAAATGLSQNYLAKRLRDELPFTLNDITRIAKALKVDETTLLLAPLVSAQAQATVMKKQEQQVRRLSAAKQPN